MRDDLADGVLFVIDGDDDGELEIAGDDKVADGGVVAVFHGEELGKAVELGEGVVWGWGRRLARNATEGVPYRAAGG
jgi:hypothetical protein